MRYTTFLAIKYIKQSKKRIIAPLSTIIAVVGIMIGVAALIVTLAIMSGFHREIKKRLLFMYPDIVISSKHQVDENKLKDFKQIKDYSPFIYGQAIIKSGDNVQTSVIKGIDFEKEQKLINFHEILIKKTDEQLKDDYVIIGKELAKNLQVDMYDDIVMIFPAKIKTPFGNLPMTRKFTVKGIFSVGVYEYDSNLCYIDIKTAKNLFFDEESQSMDALIGYGIKLKNEKYLDKMVSTLQDSFGFLYRILSWKQLNYNLFSALKLEKIVMIIVVSLIVIVACFIIISNLLMLGIQKSKDIGILLSMGARSKDIKKIFFLQGIILNITGIFSGTFLGVLLSLVIKKYQFIKLPKEVYYIDKIPIYLSIYDLSLIILIAVFAGIIASIYPAHKISKFDPIDILRYG